MSDAVFNTILSQLKNWAPKHVKQTALMLNGEPLMDALLEDRLSACKSAKLPNVGFTTNAYLMDQKRAKSIVEADPDYIVFSFDTLDKSVYESQRLRLNFDRVFSNIKGFIKARDDLNSNIRIVVRHIDSRENLKDFERFQLFFKDLLREDLDEIGYTKIHNASFMSSIKSGLDAENFGTTPCGAVFERLTIQHDGQVVLCPHDYDGMFDFGNVMDADLLTIFNSEQFEQVRNIHEDGKRNCMDKCRTCDEPELNLDGDMYAKYTPSGRRFFADVYRGFDYHNERNKPG